MHGGYQRVSSGASNSLILLSSPRTSSSGSESESSFNEKHSPAITTTELFEPPSPHASANLRAYVRSRGRWLYDVSRCVCGTVLVPILPSFLRPRALNDSGAANPHAATQSQHANGIATLDGVRGVACLIVFNFHFLFMYTLTSVRGYGVDPTGFSNRYLHQLPFIRLLFAGRAMVCVFFALSGYVLARKPLIALRSQSYDTMLQCVSSSLFRRGIRLFLPTLISTFLVLLAIRAGAFARATEIATDGVTLTYVEHHPLYLPTWQVQLQDYWVFVRTYVDFAHWDEWFNLYDPHVWTIPLEWRASMALFVTLACLARARPAWRLTLTAALVVFSVRWGRFEVVLFLAGGMLAELDLMTNTWGPSPHPLPSVLPTASPTLSTAPPPPPPPPPRTALHALLFALGAYLLSYPDEFGPWTPGFARLSALIPAAYNGLCHYRFPHSVGAVLALYAVCNARALRRPFGTPLAQYLGRVSYAFYLVHGPVLHSVGFVVMRAVFAAAGRYDAWVEEVVLADGVGRVAVPRVADSGRVGDWGYVGCLAVGWCVCLLVSLWMADVFWRVVDVPVVRLARWAEERVRGRK